MTVARSTPYGSSDQYDGKSHDGQKLRIPSTLEEPGQAMEISSSFSCQANKRGKKRDRCSDDPIRSPCVFSLGEHEKYG